MKKVLLFIAIVLSILSLSGLAYAAATEETGDLRAIPVSLYSLDDSGTLEGVIQAATGTTISSDMTISSSAGIFYGCNMFIASSGSGDGVIFYDGNETTGRKIWTVLTTAQGYYESFPPVGIRFDDALRADVSTSGNLTVSLVYKD